MKKRALISTVKDVIDDCKVLCKVLWLVFKLMGKFFATMIAVMVVFVLLFIAGIFLIVAIFYVVRDGSMIMQQYGELIQRLLVGLMIGFVVMLLFLYIRRIYWNNLNKIMKEESNEEDKMQHKDCRKCFLSPDICGAKYNTKNCEEIYEDKRIISFRIFFENAGFVLKLISIMILIVVLGAVAFYSF